MEGRRPGRRRKTRAHRAAEAAAHRSYGRLVALLAAETRDAAAAEDALSCAFVAALADWPAKGVPRNPDAWLLTVARRKWIDATRQQRTAERAAGHLRLLAQEAHAAADRASALPLEPPALVFLCGHPALDPGIQAPLLLQALLGFDAAAIAAVFRVPPAAMRQRLVRAKRKLRQAGPAFQVTDREALQGRLRALRQAVFTALSR